MNTHSRHLAPVAKISLSIAVMAGAGLLLVLSLITRAKGVAYGGTIFANNLTHQNLGTAMLVFGLAMVVIAGMITWLIALYSSFRIAGPLFRFSQNLKNVMEDPLAVLVPIRRTDMLQREWKELEASQQRLGEHYLALRKALGEAQQILAADAEPDPIAIRQAVARLVEIERLVEL